MIKQVIMYIGDVKEAQSAAVIAEMKSITENPKITVTQTRKDITPTVVFEADKEFKLKDFGLKAPWVVSPIRTYKLADA